MNHLAHAFLARHAGDAMVGALLGDFIKGDADAGYRADIRYEIRLHRRVDAFTDGHPAVRAAIARFAPGRRRFAGIALDLLFDHHLATRWDAHASEPLPAFTARVYRALREFDQPLPPALAAFGERLARDDGLAAWRDYPTVARALDRTAHRLSRGGDLLRACGVDLDVHADALAAAFDAFFPELLGYVAAQRAEAAAGPTGPTGGPAR